MTQEQRLVISLGWMYAQYCDGKFGHQFMGAGEDAAEILEEYGLMKADDELDAMALSDYEKAAAALPPPQQFKDVKRGTDATPPTNNGTRGGASE